MLHTPRALHKAELILLCLFAIALPLVEAPKNIFLLSYVALWVTLSVRQRNWGELSAGWNATFAGILGAASLSVLLSDPYPHKWSEVRDIMCYLALGWTLARSTLSGRDRVTLIVTLIAATLVGAAQGYWHLAMGIKGSLQLHSVGHVNHSALYAMGVAVLAIALAANGPTLMKPLWRRVCFAVALVLLAVMISFASRGALVAYGLTAAALLVWLARQHRIRLWPALLGAIIVTGGMLSVDRAMVVKTTQNLEAGGYTTAGRVEAARTAIEYWRQKPVTGIGAANYGAVSPAMVEGWLKARGEVFVQRNFLFSSHAHSIYFNTLAERGVIGVVALLALFGMWAAALVKLRPCREASDAHWLGWSAGVAGFGLVFIGGVFNTTLHHEHGMLGMVCLAMLLGCKRT
ncbi:O-antigen ligase family protein [Viridibacterium curvum]|uniref:O-antigen ligase-related domain-containing protein n=1 Tax=Viridibacterium curvum TaxID=1101404 RepID=A0ABP9QTQ9_9RHOO